MGTSIVRAGLVAAVLLAGCGNDQRLPPVTELDVPESLGETGLRRLSRFEIVATLTDVFGVAPDELEATLPEDIAGITAFDNAYPSQSVSPLVVAQYSAFADAYALKLAADPDAPMRLGGCTPTGAGDAQCLRALVGKVGRRMFRRALTTDELDRYVGVIAPAAVEAGSFGAGVELATLLFVQHPAFLYRTERGAGQLDSHEIATRMAFLIWGSAPDDALLDAADDEMLVTPANRVAEAERMLADPRARKNWHRFHAQWLGYSAASLPPALAADLRTETEHLVDRVVFEEDAEWLALFRWPETYVTPALAEHYGLPAQTAPGWVSYPAGRGGGLLTHGQFLTLGAKFGDTSPTVRGYEIYKRLTCGALGTIPNGVDTDVSPGEPTDCKPQRYTMRDTPGCTQCHSITDNIGFGLENFGVGGAWRETEPGLPNCRIEATGSWNGMAFSGPEELGTLVADDPRVSACATKQLFRFVTGRVEAATDEPTLAALDGLYRDTPSLRSLVLALVASPAIAYRKGD